MCAPPRGRLPGLQYRSRPELCSGQKKKDAATGVRESFRVNTGGGV